MTYRILDYSFSVEATGDVQGEGLLAHLLSGFAAPLSEPGDLYRIALRDDTYVVTRNGERFSGYGSEAQLASGLEWSLVEEATRNSSVVCVHAASLVKRGEGLLLVGPSGSGKSTLGTALLLSGWTLLSDELAPFAQGSPRAIPFPRVVCLKGSAPHLLAPLDAVGLLTKPGAARHVGDSLCFLLADTEVTNSSSPLRHIVFVTRRPGSEPALNTLPGPEALSRLISNTPNFKQSGPPGLNLLGDLVDQASAFTFLFDDLGSAVNALEELTDPCHA